MFRMTANVTVGAFKPFKPSSLKWSRSMDNIFDTATIVIPAMCRLADKDNTYAKVSTGLAIKEGDKVVIECGYDGKNDQQFVGFVNRVNFKVPVEIECEGYAYLLKRKVINKTFGRTTVKQVLEYLVQGTDIKLSPKMPGSIVFEPCTFANYTAIQVLEFLKEKYLLTVCFFFNELYVGFRTAFVGNTVKLQLNWNVVKDDQLLFRTYEGSSVHIEMQSRKPDGSREKKRALNNPKPGDVKIVKTHMQNAADMQKAADDMQTRFLTQGYTGSLLCFLKPHINPGDTLQIIDSRYQERNGSYFCGTVNGSFSQSGGRQTAQIDFSL